MIALAAVLYYIGCIAAAVAFSDKWPHCILAWAVLSMLFIITLVVA